MLYSDCVCILYYPRVLYTDCVYIVLPTCVEVVNATVLIFLICECYCFDQVISVEGRQVVYYVWICNIVLILLI